MSRRLTPRLGHPEGQNGVKKNHTSEFKAKVVLAALPEDRTTGKRFPGQALAELASQFWVHPMTIAALEKGRGAGLAASF